MAIKINTKELTEVLDLTPSTQNIMLVGKHGVGKSEILTAYFKEKGMRVVTLFLGQMSDPGDIIGLPGKVETTGADGQRVAQTDFMPPYWFPVDGKPIVLFLDELNRARPEILQTVMDLTLNRKLAGKPLPEGSRVISAVNHGEEYQLTDLDPALVSRFNIYEFCPTVEEWLNWATREHLDSRVVNFIQANPERLDCIEDESKRGTAGLDKSVDRRAWKKVSDIMLQVNGIKEIHKRLISGIVGVSATASFVRFVKENNVVTGADVLLHFERITGRMEAYDIHEYAMLNEAVYRYLEHATLADNQKETVRRNLRLYVEWLAAMKKKEALASFVSIFEKGTYGQAIVFMVNDAPDVFDMLSEFVEQL